MKKLKLSVETGQVHFNGLFRDECPNENWFDLLEQAPQAVATRRLGYNETRPHRGRGRVPLEAFAALNRKLTGDSKQYDKINTGISKS